MTAQSLRCRSGQSQSSSRELGVSLKMNPFLTIENIGRRRDRFYIGFLVIFWIIWTPCTIIATTLAISDFSFFWLIWLPFGYIGLLGIPFVLIESRKPQTLEATTDSLLIHGTGIPFSRTVAIPRTRSITLNFGNYSESDESESVATLNIISKDSWWKKRIMISALSHPTEKRKIFRSLKRFLTENDFLLHVEDNHPKSREAQDLTNTTETITMANKSQ